MGYFGKVQPDPEIERLEADLRRSRFERWEVETLLADRHRARIEALTPRKGKRVPMWVIVRELTDPVFLYLGWAGSLAALSLWMLNAPPFG